MVRQTNSSPINLSLCGCGFLGVYHVGVVCAFKEHASEILDGKMAGCSAGSLVAACAMSGCCLGQMCSDALEIAIRARSRALGPLHPTFSIVEIIRNGLRRILPTNAHEICSGRLYISLTRWKDNKNVIVNQYHTREELIQVLICSSFVPYWSGIIPHKFRGEYYWDGGLTNNNPIIDDGTILVSPFAGESDICPRDESGSFYSVDFRGTDISCTQENLYRMTHALFPPNISVLKQICWRGYIDGLKFLQTRNLVSSVRLSSTVNISSVLGTEYTEPANDDENQLRNGGIGQDIEQMYDNDAAIEVGFTTDGRNSGGNSDQSDEESNTTSSQTTYSPYGGKVLRKKELPTPLFAVFADARQKEEEPIGRYFTDSNLFKLFTYVALPVTLPIDFTYAATKRVLNNLRPSTDTNESSMPKRAVNYLWSWFGEENNKKYCYHVEDCECTESRISSHGGNRLPRHSSSRQRQRQRQPPSTTQSNVRRPTSSRKRKISAGISTVTSYRTDSSSDEEDISTMNNDDAQYVSSEAILTQTYPQPDIVMSANPSEEYCRQLQQMAGLSNLKRFSEPNELPTADLENNVSFN
ncbi:unnamed protein product [Rotaria magnacalcarata]|uniref:triacylglycerol lipase n=1 Tax=Rotaria magnacalcarata TaxID=392030 RepID=A0A815L987_9BILA|nr:unnamed protein product [Rotaria magnacalcarata]CAF1406826.1 unnamed protein product [Rotaria magnacalcarata]CAF1922611.1 unnamed protein product [Rotaria magnacalcarata]CAF3781332.1 unnamed protein product [Rotaria magnacalcarata]CAF3793841.1 unnamed protein product [Rotaria magnacalcarata]